MFHNGIFFLKDKALSHYGLDKVQGSQDHQLEVKGKDELGFHRNNFFVRNVDN